MRRLHLFIFSLAIGVSACDRDTPTSPSTETPTPTVADATIQEAFESTVPVSGAKFYSFAVGQNGTVRLTLTTVSGQFVPPTVTLGLGLGQPDGVDCTLSTQLTVSSSSAAPHITGTYAPGVYCARVWDVGNLFAPANVAVLVEHP